MIFNHPWFILILIVIIIVSQNSLDKHCRINFLLVFHHIPLNTFIKSNTTQIIISMTNKVNKQVGNSFLFCVNDYA